MLVKTTVASVSEGLRHLGVGMRQVGGAGSGYGVVAFAGCAAVPETGRLRHREGAPKGPLKPNPSWNLDSRQFYIGS